MQWLLVDLGHPLTAPSVSKIGPGDPDELSGSPPVGPLMLSPHRESALSDPVGGSVP